MGKGLTSFLSCKYPKTSSFRAGIGTGTGDSDAIYKTMNSMYLDSAYSEEEIEIEIDTEAEPETTSSIDEPEESVILHQIHSDRLFFEPNSTSCLILENTQKGENLKEEKTEKSSVPFKESFPMAMESTDPYTDFRISMEEMVAAHGLTDWIRLEELLVWYLRVNGKKNHTFIIQAFVDLLVGISSEESSSSSCITSSCITSSCITFDEVEGSES
ncbi:transcription repressor OFP13-like protein [Carex littledalei]|uniref:Transcription repressor n=1 Tax=Carex littledalei TaxID=544730 RepID=A0A833QCQ5_9POAL|nr:transcription repressor OFP13-like protein [Carex littledalei]